MSQIVDAASFLASLESAPEGGEPEVKQEPVGSAPTEPATPPAEVKTETAPEKKTGLSPEMMEAFNKLHEYERTVRAREKAIEAKERAPERTNWTKARQKAEFRRYVKEELGWEPNDLARALMTDALGANAPVEYKAVDTRLKESAATEQMIETLKAEIDSLREQQKGWSQEQVIARERANYERGLLQYVGGELDSTYPSAARAFRADREEALAEVWDILAQDAHAKLAAGGTEPPLTPEEAVAAFEKRLAKVARWTAAPAPVTPPATKTLANTVSTAPTPPAPGDNQEEREKKAWHWFNTHQP